MPLEFVTSTRGKPLLRVDDHLYRKDRDTLDGISWRCITKTCKARIITRNDTYENSPQHAHNPDTLKIAIRSELNRLKEAASQQKGLSTMAVVANVVGSVESSAVQGSLPHLDLLRRQVILARKRAGPAFPRNPSRRSLLQIPDSLKVTRKNEPFLLYDSGDTDINRLVIYASVENIELLKASREWFLDGTFKVCPSIFEQLYTIHVKLPQNRVVPVVYALLPSKTMEIYNRFLNTISAVIEHVQPEAVHMDFEIGMVKQVEQIFPEAAVMGCNFHFNQCLWRRIQGHDRLRDKYRRDHDFALRVRMFAALAFVPTADVRFSFEMLLLTHFVRENNYILSDFIDYMEGTWVGRERHPALMKTQWWNAYEATLSGMARTNNSVEGWHAAFAGRLAATHPTFFSLIEHLQTEQGLTEFVITNSQAQGVGASSKKAYRNRQQRLNSLVLSYSQEDILDYLLTVAHNISF